MKQQLTFVKPMLAAKLKTGWKPTSGLWVAERKYDGIRLIVTVDRETADDLLTDSTVRVYSRNGIHHVIPDHLRADLRRLPTGIYDMEMHGETLRSYGATALKHASAMKLAVFDILHLHEETTMDMPLRERRMLLEEIFRGKRSYQVTSGTMTLAEQRPVNSLENIVDFRDEVWGEDGEGLILKNLDTLYRPGSRRQEHWIKIKKLQTAPLTVVGFEPSKGEVTDRGPYAITVLEDAKGIRTKVKTLDDRELAKFEAEATRLGPTRHPAIGRLLWIEYQERTPDGNYRHPMWDRWATVTETTDYLEGAY